MILLSLIAILTGAAPAKPMAVQAAELCKEVVRPSSFELAPLAAAGWSEREIKNIDQAPGGKAANRMFVREGAGAVIMLNISQKSNSHYCHVLTSAPAKTINLYERALQPIFGQATKLGPTLTFFKTDNQPIIVSLSRKPDGKNVLADVMVMAFVPKDKAE